MSRPPKSSYQEFEDLFAEIVKENLEEEKILLTTNSIRTHFQIKKNKSLSKPTIRDYGVNPDGYFVKLYPDVFDYKSDGSPNKRGLIINIENFVEEFDLEKSE